MKDTVSNCDIDNDRVRVTTWQLPPSSGTGWHTHEFDYVITPVCDGTVKILQEGKEDFYFDMKNGESYFRELGIRHDVVNIGQENLTFVEVELKERKPTSIT